MLLVRSHLPSFPSPVFTKFLPQHGERPAILSSTFLSAYSKFSSKFNSKASLHCTYSKKTNAEDFSVLSSDIQWEEGSIWSTMGLYFFSLHVPLSFGGLSVVARLLHQPVIDPQTEAVSILLIQTIELCGALALLKYTMKPHSKLACFLQGSKSAKERNWLQASAVGLGFLIILILLTSFVADRLLGPKAVNDPVLKEIISSSFVSGAACFLTYCIVTPFLEEIIYRGFLLTSLASTMKWQQAVIVSSFIFSAAHFSLENFLQLFIIGSVLGYSYCWSGNLRSSFLVHSLYNAATLMVTLLS